VISQEALEILQAKCADVARSSANSGTPETEEAE
jgi:hypothetical protein